MKRFYQISAAVFAVLILASNVAIAVDSCSTWTQQPDGSYWRTCVDDNGRQYCQISVNNKVTTVDCKTGKSVGVTASTATSAQNRGIVR